MPQTMPGRYSLMIHGGAGELERVRNEESARPYLEGIELTLQRGRKILAQGGPALDAVEACTTMLEDNPLFNAGRGSVFNARGMVENDAAIMDGFNLDAGAVAAISGIANPVQLARRILEKSRHVLLAGQGALEFARQEGIKPVDQSYFHTDARWREYKQLENPAGTNDDDPQGTVGAVAMDKSGNLAAATSTGGMIGKMAGRIGDSPLPGAGLYADNASCAVSCTGQGEHFMRTVLARHIADLIEIRELDVTTAVTRAIDYLQQKVSGRGGVIVIDRQGLCASGWTTRTLIHGWIEHGGSSRCRYR